MMPAKNTDGGNFWKTCRSSFEVYLNYLDGKSVNSKFDQSTVKRLQYREKLDPVEKEHFFAAIDAFITNNKMQIDSK
jgi:hypothetical protein